MKKEKSRNGKNGDGCRRAQRALKIIFFISLAGVLFSGYMSYMEIFKGMCAMGTCRVDISIASIPACVYGLFMYLAIMIFACCGLKCHKLESLFFRR